MSTTSTKQLTIEDVTAILAAFPAWINQKPGLEPANYGCDPKQRSYTSREDWREACASMRKEARSIQQDGIRARKALTEALSYPPNPEAMTDALTAFSGRLTWNGKKFDYCTGQYWPTEYRAAAAAVLERYNHACRPKYTPGGRVPLNISELKDMVKATGSHWFDRSTMKFFRTRILPTIYSGPGGVFFVSSEQREDHTPRRFTVRRFDPKDGDISTFGEFNKLTRGAAMKEARRAAAANLPLCDHCAGSGKDYDFQGYEKGPCWMCKGNGKREQAAA